VGGQIPLDGGVVARRNRRTEAPFKGDLPVLKLTTISIRKMVSERQLKAIQRVLRSSLKNEMATGRMMRLATSRSNMHKSQ
jgi:RNA polymerase-interacting CarD/CdnL/TRCF family regulator